MSTLRMGRSALSLSARFSVVLHPIVSVNRRSSDVIHVKGRHAEGSPGYQRDAEPCAGRFLYVGNTVPDGGEIRAAPNCSQGTCLV